jgi:uncharacterized membrane protein YeaQ/YmgE (transglycosylase-associated protein family)
MGWFATIIVGAIIGWLASIIAKTNDQMGCLWNIAIGVVGSVLGGWLASELLNIRLEDGFSIHGFLAGIVGAVLLIFLLRAVGVLRRDRRDR